MTGWQPEERARVGDLLLIVSAYDGSESDLYSGWLARCLDTLPDRDETAFIIKHYSQLIKKLGAQVMNQPMMEQFYELMRDEGRFQSATALKSMLEDFIPYRAQRLLDHFKHDLTPFTDVDIHRDTTVFFTGVEVGDSHLGIDVTISFDHSNFMFWDRNDREGSRGRAQEVLEKMGILEEYTSNNGYFRRKQGFAFPSQEAELYEYIKSFKQQLGDMRARHFPPAVGRRT
jgi:hypothetical protein